MAGASFWDRSRGRTIGWKIAAEYQCRQRFIVDPFYPDRVIATREHDFQEG
jgi:hypothetical protein